MSLAAIALVDLAGIIAEERILLGIPTMTDALLETKLNEASDWIEHETQNAFIRRTITDEEHLLIEAADDLFLLRRPIVSITSIVDPAGTTFDLTKISIAKQTGVIFGDFSTTHNTAGLPAPWKVTYVAGAYENRAAVPPALQNACKLVLAWRWRVNAEAEDGDMIPRMIKQALTGFYSLTTVFG